MAKRRTIDKAQLEAARTRRLRDLIAPDLEVLFCGINPGLYSAAVGHHFARPGNRFWPALHRGGFTPRQLRPEEESELLALGYGITNIATRATAAADELTAAELIAGGRRLVAKLKRYAPRYVAVLGVGAYRVAFDDRHAVIGRQPRDLAGVPVWVLPSPSGLNAHYGLSDLAAAFRELLEAAREEV